MSGHVRRILPLLTLSVLPACGDAAPPPDAPGEPPTAAPPPAAASPTGTGDAARGAELYQAKGCPACHTVGGGRLVGPDLAGVTERRERDWIIGMIVRPDSMLREDETARALLAEYFTPMAPLGITDAEAVDLYAYLRAPDG